MNNIYSIILQTMLIFIVSSTSVFSANVVRVTGIPDENPTELQRKNKPLVEYLQQKLGSKVKYVPVTDYGAAVAALASKKVDFAWLGGFTHVQARVLTGATPVVMRDIDRKFKSIFIANKKSGINSIKDIRNKPFAFGSKSSTSGHLMPRHFLLSMHEINPDSAFKSKPIFSGAHDATVKMVESGRVKAGALNIQVWQRMLKSKKVDANRVKAIWETPEYVDYVWTARKDLDKQIVEKFKLAFLSLDASKQTDQKVLELQGAKKFVKASPKDFDDIEKVGRQTGLLK